MNDPASSNPFAAAAATAVAQGIKGRARRYARWPMALDTLHPGLGSASPDTLVAVAAHLVEREEKSPRRWFGFGGEVCLLNARAALLLGRAWRRRERIYPLATAPSRPI